VLGIVNSEIVKVTDKNVQQEIDINTEVLGIVNGEIVKVTDESVQKEIYINTEVLGYFFLYILICYFYYFTINYP
jgi:Pyruvate/2-oxoacid:ferredoxin oxidoreductase gamma subunit